MPTRRRELVAFALTACRDQRGYREQVGSIDRFRDDYARRAPILAASLESVDSFDRVTVAPGFRMRADSWVDDQWRWSAMSRSPSTPSPARASRWPSKTR
ncbi:hypothetical protein AB0J74_22415 [Asanoa sp. NPDC049573]|uniref:hypothetical protein n=1 Tax=Asanoa sp. NPDC049573 TaxID=3155396 RepID=UPI00342C75A6